MLKINKKIKQIKNINDLFFSVDRNIRICRDIFNGKDCFVFFTGTRGVFLIELVEEPCLAEIVDE